LDPVVWKKETRIFLIRKRQRVKHKEKRLELLGRTLCSSHRKATWSRSKGNLRGKEDSPNFLIWRRFDLGKANQGPRVVRGQIRKVIRTFTTVQGNQSEWMKRKIEVFTRGPSILKVEAEIRREPPVRNKLAERVSVMNVWVDGS